MDMLAKKERVDILIIRDLQAKVKFVVCQEVQRTHLRYQVRRFAV